MKGCTEIEPNSAPIKALAHLFNLTQNFLWDDPDNRVSTLPKHIRFKYDDDDDDHVAKISSDATLKTVDDGIVVVNDEGVIEEMNALGLPLSFQTNKKKKGKSKIAQHMKVNSLKSLDERVEESCKWIEGKPCCADIQVKSRNSFSSSLPDKSEHSGLGSNNTHDTIGLPNFCERHIPTDMAADLIPDGLEEQVHDNSPLNQPAETVFDDHREDDTSLTWICYGTCGDWAAYWDTFSSRYYFYNGQTNVSAWDPPPGMESFASGEEVLSVEDKIRGFDMSSDHSKSEDPVSVGSSSDLCDSLTTQMSNANSSTCTVAATHDDDDFTNVMHIEEGDLQMMDTCSGTKQTTKRKNRRRKKSLNNTEANEFYQDEESCIDITRYWRQRYILFSRFDQGIKMDEEGWFSVTPEAIAKHQASRCRGGTVIDFFTGVGGNAIQFAKTNSHVIAIDIDPNRIDHAYHNSVIYGVQDKIDFVLADSLSLASKLKADSVFLSPPWGGPDYVKVKSYSLDMLQPYDGQYLFDTFKIIAPLIIMFLPRNVDIEELAELALSADPPWSLEVERNYLNGKLKAVTAYFCKP